MRTLRKDYARYNDKDIDDMVSACARVCLFGCIFILIFIFIQERDLGDEYGWKQVHGDVFRPPAFTLLLSSVVGSGYQIAFVIFTVVIFAIVGELYTE